MNYKIVIKMRCPKDADTTKSINHCQKVSPNSNWICTRLKGHQGKHHAHNMTKQCLIVWND